MKIRFFFFIFFTGLGVLLLYCGCSRDLPASFRENRNLIIIVVDGARYTETWGEATRQYIPHRNALLAQGTMCSSFYNNGTTSTVPGHTAMCTGLYQNINNSGLEYPARPSIFQYWQKSYQRPKGEAWVIATKDKLEVLSDCTDPSWKGICRPLTDCGVNGLGSGFREDSVTFKEVKKKLSSFHVRLAIVNFKQPDASGHAADSLGYLQGILDTDNYIYEIWNQIQSDPFYKDRTTMIVTNDHGRHTAGHLDGFVSHGDGCDGCRHIEFFAIGPDIKKNYVCTLPYEQIDISATVAELMGFSMPSSDGKVMKDILK
ncbi:MAG: alkaline phosphatase family protein [Bacteroidia bacterium]